MNNQGQQHGNDKKTSSSGHRKRPRRPKSAQMNAGQQASGAGPGPSENNKSDAQKSKASNNNKNATPKSSKNSNPKLASKSIEAGTKKDNNKTSPAPKVKESATRPQTAQQNARKHSKSTPVPDNGQNYGSRNMQHIARPAPFRTDLGNIWPPRHVLPMGVFGSFYQNLAQHSAFTTFRPPIQPILAPATFQPKNIQLPVTGDGNISGAAAQAKGNKTTRPNRSWNSLKKNGKPEVLQSFKWQHFTGKQDWWHKEMMKYISSRPEDLGELEQEMKKTNAVITVAGNHVVVAPRILDDKTHGNWRGECETVLKEYFAKYAIHTIEVDTFDPTQYQNPAVDVHLQKSVSGVLTISVTGPSKLVEQTVYQVKQRSDQVISKDMYIKPSDSPKITSQLKQNILAETRVKVNWDRQNFLKLTGNKNAIRKAKKMINEQLEEANDDLRIAHSHLPRATNNLLQHVRGRTGVFLRWANPEVISITGMPRSVELARQLIVDEIYRVDVQKIPAPGWVLDRCRIEVTKAKQFFPEIEIWSEEGFICIRGHPSETFRVCREFSASVQRFGEYPLHVKKKFHAALIGKGGTKINEIQSRHNVRVVIPPRDEASCIILLRGEKTNAIQAKFEMETFVKQLELQNSTLPVPLSHSLMQRISDEFLQKLRRENNVEVTKTEEGVLIKGKQEILQNVKDSIMSEVALTVHIYIRADDWLKPKLMSSLKEEILRFPDLQVAPDCVQDEVVLTGHPYEAKILGDIMREKVAELEANYDCMTVTVKKQFHRNIIGAKGSNIKKLRDQYKVDITIPPNSSKSCGVKVQGPKHGVEATVREIRQLADNLDKKSKKQLRFTENEMGDVKKLISELNSMNVKTTFKRNQVTFSGQYDDVEHLAEMLKEKLRINRQRMQIISISLNSSQAFAVMSRKNLVLNALRRDLEGMVTIEFDSSVPALLLKGSGSKMIEAHVRIVESLQELNDFCVLDVKVDESEMGKFIGKDGKNVKSLQENFRELEIKTNRMGETRHKNVSIAGKKDAVEQAFICIRCRHRATKVGYQKFTPRRRHASAANQPHRPESMSSYNDEDDDDSVSVCSSISDCVLEMESVLYNWQTASPSLLDFVKKSETYNKKLQNLFSDESVLINSDDRTVTVVGQANDSDCWQNNIDAKLTDFFEEFSCQQVLFHPRTKIDKVDVNSEDLVVSWDGLTANVYGLKNKVAEKLLEFETIKNRKRSVCTILSYEKCLIRFMKRNSSTEDTITTDGSFITITLTNDHVEFHSEILEVDSQEEWENKCKKALNEIFSGVTYRKVQVPSIYCGQMRTECCQCDDYVVEWIQEESALLIYGLEKLVLKETRRLEDVLFDLKNKKKNVSMKYQCENAEISTFVKESIEHFESLVKCLGHLGSPVLDSNIVMVIGEILETESTAKWEEECRGKIEQCLQRYKVVRIQVEENIRARCPSLAKPGSGVITKWIESECAFCIIGIKQLVDVSERYLQDNINRMLAEEVMFNYDYYESTLPASDEIELTIPIRVDNAVLSYLELEESQKSLQGVTVAKTDAGVEITGKGRRLQKAKEYIDSIFAEDLSIRKFGVYEFLMETSTRWQLEARQIENNCSIHVERLLDPEYGDDKFILLPKNSNVPVTVKVEEGDIAMASVDLIVNTTSKSFSFNGPLSRYIFQKAGELLRYQIETIDQDIRFSDGGSLNCKNIFHVAIPNTGDSMEDLLLKILTKADEMKMKSIAMPTIGAGNGGWKSQDISMAMQNAFTKFAPESINLKLIKVVLFTGMSISEKQLFHRNIKIRAQSDGNSAPAEGMQGLFSRLHSFFKGRASQPTPVQEVPPKPKHAEPVALDGSKKTDQGQYARILISASNQADLDKAVDEVRKLTSLYIHEFELDNASVLRISQSDLDVLEKMADEHNVRVIVDKTRDVHKVTVQGRSEGASKIKDKVLEILGGTSSDLPAEWIPSQERMTSVSLDRNSSEYRDIEKLFREGNKRLLTVDVSSICRIQNPALYRQYQSKKDEIKNRPVPPKTTEMRLFHGTEEYTIDLICRDGFNRSYAGKNATVYGKGTYFSTQSSYSHSYTRQEGNGRRQMFVADVLTGDYCNGDSSMIDAPRNPATQELYDSVVDRSGPYTQPTIYVVFRDWSAYPSYVITYTAI